MICKSCHRQLTRHTLRADTLILGLIFLFCFSAPSHHTQKQNKTNRENIFAILSKFSKYYIYFNPK